MDEPEIKEAEPAFESSPYLNIEAAYNALCAVDAVDTAIMSKDEKKSIDKVKKQALRIICIEIDRVYKLLSEEE